MRDSDACMAASVHLFTSDALGGKKKMKTRIWRWPVTSTHSGQQNQQKEDGRNTSTRTVWTPHEIKRCFQRFGVKCPSRNVHDRI